MDMDQTKVKYMILWLRCLITTAETLAPNDISTPKEEEALHPVALLSLSALIHLVLLFLLCTELNVTAATNSSFRVI